jgi:peptidoglycan hydrolase-like protein with peptidoglycan-binding domain
VKAFQQMHGIASDGKANPETVAAIEQALATA